MGISRLYCFNNMYLSGIQNGIQAAHAAVDLVSKYIDPLNNWSNLTTNIVGQWTYDKTMIVLSAGDSEVMEQIYNHMILQDITGEGNDEQYPWAAFREDGMDGLLTSIAVVLPKKMYDPELNPDGTVRFTFTPWEIALREFIKKSSLAR